MRGVAARCLIWLVSLALIAAACSGNGTEANSATTAPTTTVDQTMAETTLAPTTVPPRSTTTTTTATTSTTSTTTTTTTVPLSETSPVTSGLIGLLDDAGLGCSNVTSRGPEKGDPTQGFAELVKCEWPASELPNDRLDSLTITVYDTELDRLKNTLGGLGFGCSAGIFEPVIYLTYAFGETWTVSSDRSDELMDEVAEALGGEVNTVGCAMLTLWTTGDEEDPASFEDVDWLQSRLGESDLTGFEKTQIVIEVWQQLDWPTRWSLLPNDEVSVDYIRALQRTTCDLLDSGGDIESIADSSIAAIEQELPTASASDVGQLFAVAFLAALEWECGRHALEIYAALAGGPTTTIPAIPPGTESVEILDRSHVEGPVDYDRAVPAGGPHAAVPLQCGIYEIEVPRENAVHSLEHGAVWITYRPDMGSAGLATLTAVASSKGKVILSPVADQPAPVMATAWGWQLQLQEPDDPRLEAFVVELESANTAPEPGGACRGLIPG